MRDVWMLAAVLAVAVGVGLTQSSQTVAARSAPASLTATAAPPAAAGEVCCPAGEANAGAEACPTAGGQACTPGDPNCAGQDSGACPSAAAHDAASPAKAGTLTADQMATGVCPVSSPTAAP